MVQHIWNSSMRVKLLSFLTRLRAGPCYYSPSLTLYGTHSIPLR